jgi:molybdate transport system permease protein
MFAFTPEELEAVRLSIKVAFWAMLASLPPALLVAMVLARGRFPGKGLLNALVHLPLVLPPVVTGFVLLVLFGRNGSLGRVLAEIGVVFAFRWTGAALACAVMGFPLMVRSMRLSIEAVDRGLEQAAQTLGANRWWVFLTVTLPLILPGVIAGMILCFARAMGEFGATITFVSSIPGQTQTLPLAIFSYSQIPGAAAEQGMWRLAVLSIVVSLGALLVAEYAVRRVEHGRSA